MKKKTSSYYFSIGLIFVLFSTILYFYLRNITHDVYAGDIGDIASAAALFGVPHPPGYPLITFLGFLFSKLPLPLPILSKISLVSVLAAFGGAILYFKFVLDIFYNSGKKNNFAINFAVIVVAILSTAILAFSYYYWLYAEVPEVFAFNNFFIIATYFAAYTFYRTKSQRYLYLTSLLVGLSMTNQQAIMFAFPGLFVLVVPELLRTYFSKALVLKKNFRTKLQVFIKEFSKNFFIVKNVLLAFLIGLSPYVYVFISASTNPQINWMKEPTIYNFIRLLLRMDYSFAENLVNVTQRLVVQQIYFSTLITNYSLVLTLIGVIGAIYLLLKDKRLFSALLIGFLFSGPIFIFIITPEIIDPDELGIVERMFIQSFVIFSFFIPFGFFAIQNLLYKIFPRKVYSILILVPFFITVSQMIYYNLPKTDLSKTKIGSNFVYDILEPLPKNSVIFLLGDLGTLNTWYVHYVEGYRPDIVLAGSYGDRNDFENSIVREYKIKNKNTKLTSEAIVVTMLPELLKKRKVFSMYQFPLGRNDYVWVPKGLVFELMSVSEIPVKEDYFKQVGNIISKYDIAYRDKLLPSEQNNIVPYMSKQYSNAFNYMGDFLYVYYDDRRNAFGFYSRAQIIDPANPLTYAKMGIVQSELPNQCPQAVENIETAISMYKIYRPYYTFALRIYNKCKINEEKIKRLKTIYKNLFGKDLEKDLHY